MGSDTPMLSVTVLNYNYGHFLPNCIESILRQSFRDFELILINDRSTDNSREVIEPYLADPRVRLVDHQQNEGFVRSLIEGAELSRGTYITVISADDWIVSGHAFEQQIALLEHDPEIAFVYSAYSHYVDEQTYESTWHGANQPFVLPGSEALKQLLVNPFLLHTGTVIRKTAYEQIGGYDSTTKFLVDTRMWLSLCHVGKVAYLDEALYAYRRHGANMSRKASALRREIGEVLQTIAWSFGKLPIGEQQALRGLRKEAERRALTAFAMDDIFRNHYQAGWKSYWIAFQLRPLQTIFQRNTLILLARTILGQIGYDAVIARKPRASLKHS